ncbi:hypothetical protein [Bacillus andreraoultii]|uniref:hypothetical protein n=1 Tax=Bacillus andreraoultii TaxID=1499685 RepID=UPI00053AA659|nr:hypothetical protein [Bacillus andreraoultii]
MKPPSFNHHFKQIALERIEGIRLQFQRDEYRNFYQEWELHVNEIEKLLPSEKRHLITTLKDMTFQMNDDYDVQIFKQGFADGFLFIKDLLEQNQVKK